ASSWTLAGLYSGFQLCLTAKGGTHTRLATDGILSLCSNVTIKVWQKKKKKKGVPVGAQWGVPVSIVAHKLTSLLKTLCQIRCLLAICMPSLEKCLLRLVDRRKSHGSEDQRHQRCFYTGGGMVHTDRASAERVEYLPQPEDSLPATTASSVPLESEKVFFLVLLPFLGVKSQKPYHTQQLVTGKLKPVYQLHFDVSANYSTRRSSMLFTQVTSHSERAAGNSRSGQVQSFTSSLRTHHVHRMYSTYKELSKNEAASSSQTSGQRKLTHSLHMIQQGSYFSSLSQRQNLCLSHENKESKNSRFGLFSVQQELFFFFFLREKLNQLHSQRMAHPPFLHTFAQRPENDSKRRPSAYGSRRISSLTSSLSPGLWKL
uniref:COP9 signalosome complex subunit 3 N-terminal helical repeats domain-containing protein n=1 Tax=Sus scrofa TaxID=9823 RepID=A0A8D0PCK7_PIG